jgi:hypothetical protein
MMIANDRGQFVLPKVLEGRKIEGCAARSIGGWAQYDNHLDVGIAFAQPIARVPE